MAKKLILLMLCIPIIIMISLFTTTTTVSLAIDVPVNNVEVTSEKFLYIDIDEKYDETISYTVYPTNAKNKEVTFEVEDYGDKRADVEVSKEGKITVNTPGQAKINVVTVDGGYKDSVIVTAIAGGIKDITATPLKTSLGVGETTKIEVVFDPDTIKDKLLEYSSSNPDKVAVDGNGNIRGLRSGKSTIRVSSKNHPSVYDEFEITVSNNDFIEFSESKVELYEGNYKDIPYSVDIDEEYDLSIVAYDNDGNKTDDLELILNEEESYVRVKFNNSGKDGEKYRVEAVLTALSGKIATSSFEVTRRLDFELIFEGTYDMLVSGSISVPYKITPVGIEGIKIDIKTSNPNLEVTKNTDNLSIYASEIGVYEVTLKASLGEIVKEKSVTILVLPLQANFDIAANNYGIENLLTIGGNGEKFKLNYTIQNLANGLEKYFIIKSNCPEVTVDENNNIIINQGFTGEVEFSLIFKYEEFEKEYSKVKVRCIGKAYNVSNYSELIENTKFGNIVVLMSNINDFPSYLENDDYIEIPTTYDNTWYKNSNLMDKAKVKILVTIKNDLYGNGYAINAHNSTYSLDEAGQPNNNRLFQSPLNFVAATNSGASAASVKAQDNIVFGVYENVNICNVTLQGCNDVDDLTKLDFVGTTVEILGDNTSITYSRIKNGRTVIRAFGDVNDPNKEIHFNLANSIVSNAREFSLRLGTNKFVIGNDNTPSPYLDNEIFKFPIVNQYMKYNEIEKEEYDSKYIKTFVNLSNVAIEKSGIFTIALDSHFSGVLLANGKKFGEEYFPSYAEFLNSWYDLASTSYGVKLTLENEVWLYDWKPVTSVNSDTLIETSGQFEDSLKFDVAALLKGLASKPEYSGIIYNSQGYEDYVHGGIALFGGGKNYSVVEYGSNFSAIKYNSYEIGLADAGAQTLEFAAGQEKFAFLVYDARTYSFTPKLQDEKYASGKAYDFVYSKGR